MPLAEYLASEQAREDVRLVVAKPHDVLRYSGNCGPWLERTTLKAWTRLGIEGADQYITAYYRPDGDRYVVTDLGEGVRALRLRTGWIHGRANGHAMQERETLASGGVGWVAGMSGDIELDGVKEDQLPDALCRVMRASLRVANITNQES